MKNLVLSKGADHDLAEAIAYYNLKKQDLGDVFFENFYNKTERIIRYSFSYSIRYRNIRCAKIDKFPFAIHYQIEGETILVVAVFHSSRNQKEILKRK